MTSIPLVLFIAGLLLLVVGAEVLVRGASQLARSIGISPLVIGLTVVAYGTSAPELAVSIRSGLVGQADIALGNVIGSNIFNVLFILGVAALITPLVVSQQLVRLDVPVMIGVSFLLGLLAFDGNVSRVEGILLCISGVVYTVFCLWQGRRETAAVTADHAAQGHPHSQPAPRHSWSMSITLIIAGLILLVLGAHWLVESAVALAQTLGMSELIIGLTIVAAGTSLPEVATSVVASLRRERDLAVGNVVGSNIFNILVVLGCASLVAPGGTDVAPAALRFDIPVLIAVAIACLPIFFTGNVIARWEGGLFLGYYIAYTLYVILAATQHQALPVFNAVMLLFVLPLTGITLVVGYVRAVRLKRHHGGRPKA